MGKLKKLFFEDDYMAKPLRKGKTLFIFCMVIVALVNFAIFYVAVNINSIIMAFKWYDTDLGYHVISWGHFETLFNDLALGMGGVWLPAFVNTMMYFWTNLLIILPITYFVSYFLYKQIWCYKFYRVLFFMPSIISAIVLVAAFQNIFVGGESVLATIKLKLFNIDTHPNYLNEHTSANLLMLFYCIWSGFGTNVVLFQSAMKRIPESVIEAGQLDGVGMFSEMFKIVTPLVWPTIMTTITIALSAFLTASGPILLFTEGSANTQTISFQIYWLSLGNSKEYAAAVGIVCTIISIPIVLGLRNFFGRLFETVEY